ncbi:hypothetical protein NC653_033310 [Populus alba x Populus x berolinensis]|uniref:Uncharacterized protein n=1 Tax=Populus alba x Populus x berolinensis TaxID=444605 RepID=A0AAD6PZ45_9ROSI|nr:hypothetical protein NC653_033310 [Populus alba x Populus x berolinensis]
MDSCATFYCGFKFWWLRGKLFTIFHPVFFLQFTAFPFLSFCTRKCLRD